MKKPKRDANGKFSPIRAAGDVKTIDDLQYKIGLLNTELAEKENTIIGLKEQITEARSSASDAKGIMHSAIADLKDSQQQNRKLLEEREELRNWCYDKEKEIKLERCAWVFLASQIKAIPGLRLWMFIASVFNPNGWKTLKTTIDGKWPISGANK